MSEIPADLRGYTLLVTEPPAVKTRMTDNGELVPVTNRDGEVQFTLGVIKKPPPGPTGRYPKGEDIRVTLPADPGDGFGQGTAVELISPIANDYQIADRENTRLIAQAGVAWRAAGVRHAQQRHEPPGWSAGPADDLA